MLQVIAGPSSVVMDSYRSRSFLLTSSGMSHNMGYPSSTTSAILTPLSSRVPTEEKGNNKKLILMIAIRIYVTRCVLFIESFELFMVLFLLVVEED